MPDDNFFTDMFKDADKAFNGKYKDQLNALHGLSKEELDSIIPAHNDYRTLNHLIKVVEHASINNLSEAELATNIKSLGKLALKIAKKVPGLASMI